MTGERTELSWLLAGSTEEGKFVLRSSPLVYSTATILQLGLFNFILCLEARFSALSPSGCGVYLGSWKSGKPEHALCEWAAYALPGPLCALPPPAWRCTRRVMLTRH